MFRLTRLICLLLLALILVLPIRAQDAEPTAEATPAQVTPVASEVPDADETPVDVPSESEWREIVNDLIERGSGVAPDVIYTTVLIVVIGIISIALPGMLMTWRSQPLVFKAASYPVIDSANRWMSDNIARRIETLRTDSDPTNDYLIPDLLARLTQSEDAREQFARAAREAGIQVNFARITAAADETPAPVG